jgi:predicted Zn-dependent protease
MKHSMTCAFRLALAVVNPSWASTQDKKKDPVPTGNREVGKGLNFYSLEDEIALGRQLAAQVERQAKLVDDPVVSEYVNRIGQNLARNSDVRVPVTVKVIDDDQVNAFALPGGFIFVNTGLLLKADNEAQVAACWRTNWRTWRPATGPAKPPAAKWRTGLRCRSFSWVAGADTPRARPPDWRCR